MSKEPSWWHFLWIIPAVIITESAAILRLMRGREKGDKKDERRR